MNIKKRCQVIKAAKGEIPCTCILKNGYVFDVFNKKFIKSNIGIYEDRIVGIGDYEGNNIIDVTEKYVIPGFIDSHVHIESSMITPPSFAKAVLPQGTTTVVIDPHEIANVLGHDGIRYMLEASKDNLLSVFVMLPSCVPATHMETSGAELLAQDLYPFISEKWVLGLAEVMNYPAIINCDMSYLSKIQIAQDKVIDGHAPMLRGKNLDAYVAAGIESDHECINVKETLEKIRLGMYVMIREGTAAKNLEELIKAVNNKNYNRFLFCTDDKHVDDIISEGHINYNVRKAVELGLSPEIAISMATLNAAQYFDLRDRGCIAPGKRADIQILPNLEDFNPEIVLRGGVVVSEAGKYIYINKHKKCLLPRSSMNVKNWKKENLVILDKGKKIRVIEVIKNQLLTNELILEPTVKDNIIISDVERDILKIAVVERHRATGNVGIGFVKGIGLKKGAMASTVAHDSHNIVVIGCNDEDMDFAIHELIKSGGGQIVVKDKKILAQLELSVAGLMSVESSEIVVEKIKGLEHAVKGLGSYLSNPMLVMSFLSLPVIPHIKLTDLGLIKDFQMVKLEVD